MERGIDMKKMAVVIIAILITMSIAHTVSANGSVGITLGYSNRGFERQFGGISNPSMVENSRRAIAIGISAGMYVADRVSISFNGTYLIGNNLVKYNEDPKEAPSFSGVNLHLFGRYDLLTNSKYKIGVQVGAIYEFLKDNMDFLGINDYSELKLVYDGTLSTIAIVAGVYGEIEVLPRVKVFADIKMPVIEWKKGDAVVKRESKSFMFPGLDDEKEDTFARSTENVFWKNFMYDLKLGFEYQINSTVSIGLFGHVSNINMDTIMMASCKMTDAGSSSYSWNLMPRYTSPAFSISLGAKYVF